MEKKSAGGFLSSSTATSITKAAVTGEELLYTIEYISLPRYPLLNGRRGLRVISSCVTCQLTVQTNSKQFPFRCCQLEKTTETRVDATNASGCDQMNSYG